MSQYFIKLQCFVILIIHNELPIENKLIWTKNKEHAKISLEPGSYMNTNADIYSINFSWMRHGPCNKIAETPTWK